MTKTKTNIFREHLQRAIPETCDPLRHLIRVRRRDDLTKKKDNDKDRYKDKDNDKDKYIKRTNSMYVGKFYQILIQI